MGKKMAEQTKLPISQSNLTLIVKTLALSISYFILKVIVSISQRIQSNLNSTVKLRRQKNLKFMCKIRSINSQVDSKYPINELNQISILL